MDTDGSNVHSWVGPFGAEPLAWSPDGTKILVATDTEVRIYDDVPNGGYSTIDTTSNGTVTSLDWIGNIWALVHAKDMGTTIPASVAATAPVGSAGFSDLFTPVAVPGTTPTQYQPIAGDIRIRPDGTVAWDGQVSWGATAQHGIFTGSGTFQLNTGPTQSFAFSPDGNEVVAARSGNVDVVSWSGPYERTLATGTVCGVDWTRGGTQPLAALTYRGSGNPDEFVFDGSASTATAPGATLTSYDWQFDDGTDTGPIVTHHFSAPGQHTVQLTVTDSNGLQAVASTALVPKLTISQVTVSPASPASGNPFGIEVTVRNDGGVPITSVAPQVSIAPGTVATVDTGPTPASADLAAGTQATFDFAATALAGGDATATVDASGAGPGGPVSAGQRQTDLTVGGDLLPLDLTVDSSDIGVGGTTAVHVHVTNGTGHSITGLAPTLTVTPTSGVTLGGPTGGATTLVAGDDATFDYTLTATQAATLSLDAGASATVPFDGSAVQSVHRRPSSTSGRRRSSSTPRATSSSPPPRRRPAPATSTRPRAATSVRSAPRSSSRTPGSRSARW